MDAGLFIAFRYLFAKKSHNVINVISAISAAGMAVGTAAIIIIMSVYNGFDRIIENNLSDMTPDVLVSPREGRRFVPKPGMLSALKDFPGVESVSCVLEDNVFLTYDGRQGVAAAKGVDSVYERTSALGDYVVTGDFALHRGDLPLAAVGTGLASQLGINPRFLERMTLFFPETGEEQLGEVNSVRLSPSCLFSVSSSLDASLIVLPIEAMRELLGSDDAVSGIEMRFSTPPGAGQLREIRALVGEDCSVKDRYMQNDSIYKMMRYEKLAIFLILFFVVVIIAFNIFGSLSMLMTEKKPDIAVLGAIGASDRLVRRIFLLEGWLISLVGMAVGVVFGVGLTLLQQHFGLLKMPGGFFIQSYPVELQLADVLLAAAGVAAIGFVVASVSSRKRD